MEDKFIYTEEERLLSDQLLEELKGLLEPSFAESDLPKLRKHLEESVTNNKIQRNVFGLNPILCSIQTAIIAVRDIGLKRDSVIAILLYQSVQDDNLSLEDVNKFIENK